MSVFKKIKNNLTAKVDNLFQCVNNMYYKKT